MATLVNLWDTADQQLVALGPPHADSWYAAYLAWYQPKTRCRILYADTQPARHQATTQDSYPRHRDEALAGAVSTYIFLAHKFVGLSLYFLCTKTLHSLYVSCSSSFVADLTPRRGQHLGGWRLALR